MLVRELTDKQKKFCDYYLETSNATESYIKAGYNEKGSRANASRMIANDSIKAYLAQRRAQMDEERIAKPEEVLKYLTSVMRGEIKDQFDLDAPLQERTRAAESLAKRFRLYDATFINDFEKRKNELQLKELELKNAKLEAETKKLTENEIIEGEFKPFELPAKLIAPCYIETLLDIKDKGHREYILKGGRGSAKSSFVSEIIIDLLKNNPQMHAVVMRKVKDTLRDSVYSQMMWAISALELENEFKCSVSPMEITYIPTGQKIYFRGLDEPTKLKGIKPTFGYVGIAWFEELDQYNGAEQIRSAEQSVIRGGDEAFIFKTFNPPKTANNWANKYCQIPKESQYQIHTTYEMIPKKWIGKAFIDEAEHIKSINPTAYEHEYLGIANGNGGNVFDNVEVREITDDEIKEFDRIYQAVDFGWYPDPWAFVKVHFDAARRILYIFDEHKANKKSNRETYEIMVNEHGITPNDKVTCDSAEPKSIEDYRSYGLFARAAIKGPGSVEYSMKWLQSLTKIVIDNKRCPESAQEFLDYEYERDKDEEVITGYPDKNNHFIDSTRYACNDIWKRRGE